MWYCWWKKSGDHQLRLVAVYAIICRVFAPAPGPSSYQTRGAVLAKPWVRWSLVSPCPVAVLSSLSPIVNCLLLGIIFLGATFRLDTPLHLQLQCNSWWSLRQPLSYPRLGNALEDQKVPAPCSGWEKNVSRRLSLMLCVQRGLNWMFLRSRVVGITASSPLLQRAYPFTWHIWHKGMGCRDSSAWIVCIYRWMVRLVMNTTFLENPKLSLNLRVVILCQNSLGGGCTSGAPLISDLLPRWLYALLQFRLIWCCFGLGCAMPSYLVVCAPPTRGPVTLHRLQTLLLRERESCWPVHRWVSVTTFLRSPRGGEQATVEKGCEKVFLHHPRWLFGIPSTVLIIYANIHALLGTNISHYQGTFEGDYLVPWKIGISCIKQYSNIIL